MEFQECFEQFTPESRVLDVGCGIGDLSAEMSKRVPNGYNGVGGPTGNEFRHFGKRNSTRIFSSSMPAQKGLIGPISSG